MDAWLHRLLGDICAKRLSATWLVQGGRLDGYGYRKEKPVRNMAKKETEAF